MRSFLAASTVLFTAAWGCSAPGPEPDLSSILAGVGEDRPGDLGASEFDFGTVLARDQTLRHEFAVANGSDRPIRLLRATAKVPCCSDVGKLPESIPPGGEVQVPVYLKAGHSAERKLVSFEIETDSKAEPIRTLSVRARFVPEWEWAAPEGAGPAVGIGKVATRSIRVVSRRKAGEGLRSPVEVVASGPLRVDASARAVEVEGSDGVIESSRELVVTLPPQPKPGEYRGEVACRWPNGTVRTHEVRWEVTPSLRMSPPSLIVKPSEGPITSTVMIASDGGPFRVLRVSGPMLNGPVAIPERSSTRQTLRLSIDSARVLPGQEAEIEIATDHPDQPALTLGVLVLPPDKRRSE